MPGLLYPILAMGDPPLKAAQWFIGTACNRSLQRLTCFSFCDIVGYICYKYLGYGFILSFLTLPWKAMARFCKVPSAFLYPFSRSILHQMLCLSRRYPGLVLRLLTLPPPKIFRHCYFPVLDRPALQLYQAPSLRWFSGLLQKNLFCLAVL